MAKLKKKELLARARSQRRVDKFILGVVDDDI